MQTQNLDQSDNSTSLLHPYIRTWYLLIFRIIIIIKMQCIVNILYSETHLHTIIGKKEIEDFGENYKRCHHLSKMSDEITCYNELVLQ